MKALMGLVVAVTLVAPMTARGEVRLGPDHPEELQSSILEAFKAGKKEFVIPGGVYRLAPPAEGSHLQFPDMADFEIDGRGVTLIFTDQTRGGVEFRNCRNVRFRGATVRYETLPFTQGVVEAIAPDGKWYDVRIAHGYPTNMDDPKYVPARPTGYLFDPKTRWWKHGTYDLYGERFVRLGPDRFRMYWREPRGPDVHPVAVGDLMGFCGSGRHNVTLINCERMDITGVTIFSAGSFAVWESRGEGGNHYTFTVKRGPRPAGAATDSSILFHG